MKVASIIDETKIENKEKGRVTRKISPGESNSQGSRNFRRFKSEIKQDKGKHAVQRKPGKTYGQCGRQHPGPSKSFTSSYFECGDMGHKATNCPRVTRNSWSHTQRIGMGIKSVAQRDRLTIGTPSGDSKSSQKSQTGSRILARRENRPGNLPTQVRYTLNNQIYAPILPF